MLDQNDLITFLEIFQDINLTTIKYNDDNDDDDDYIIMSTMRILVYVHSPLLMKKRLRN